MECDYKFYLEFVNDADGILVQVDEPLGWDSIHLKMDTPNRKMFGRNCSYSDGTLGVAFVPNANGSINGHEFDKLIEYYNCYGFNSCVRFYYNECGTNVLLGILNYQGVKTDECSYFEVNIIEDQKGNLLLERLDTNAEILGTNTLNNDTGKDIPFETVCLQSKIFEVTGELELTDDPQNPTPEPYVIEVVDMNEALLGPDDLHYFYLFNNVVQEDSQLDMRSPFMSTPVNRDTNYIVQTTTDCEMTYSYDLLLEIGAQNQTGADPNVEAFIYFEHLDFANNVISSSQIANFTVPINSFYSYNNTVSSSLSMSAGDKLFMYLCVTLDGGSPTDTGSAKIVYRPYKTNNFKAVCQSIAPDTEHEIPRIRDIGCKIIDYITDGCVTLSMPEFQSGGKYYNYFATNGYEIRQAEDKQFVYDFKRWIESLNAIFAVGYQIQGDEVFVGTVHEFYKPEFCSTIGDLPFEYQEEFDDSFTLNEFNFKYKKTPKDQLNTIDEFNTSAQYNIPTEKIKGKCDVKSDILASGYLIELERRKSFDTEGTVSSDFDDDLFIIDMVYNGRLMKYENRTDQNITVTPGTLVSPETSYNLSLSPLQNFSRWWCYIGSALYFKTESTEIKTVFFEGNEEMESAVQDSCTFTKLATQKFQLDKSCFYEPIFNPVKVEASYNNITLTRMLEIKKELIEKRGYHTIKNAKGKDIDLYITAYDYSPCERVLEITGTKKNENYI